MAQRDGRGGVRTLAARHLFAAPDVDAGWNAVRSASEGAVVRAVLRVARNGECGVVGGCSVAVWLEPADFEALVPYLGQVRARIEGLVARRSRGPVRVVLAAGPNGHRGVAAALLDDANPDARGTLLAGGPVARAPRPAPVREVRLPVMLGIRLGGRLVPVPGPLVLGRTVVGPGRIDDPRASGRHCRLVPAGRGLRCHDLGSRNGTAVDGEGSGIVSVAFPGSHVLIGRTDILVERVR